MAIKAINLAKTVQFESCYDEAIGTPDATIWTLGALDSRLLSQIKDKATAIPMSSFGGSGDGMATLRMNEMNFDIVCFGLKNVTNYEMTFTTVQRNIGGRTYLIADPDFVATIPDEILEELANQILQVNQLSETEKKKLRRVVLATQLEGFKDRRCSTCTDKDKLKYGCEKDIKPFLFDGEKITRCPLRPFKESPAVYSEYFQLYSFFDKHIMAEPGSFYDQPALYVEVMQEKGAAIADGMNPKKVQVPSEEDQKLAGLQAKFGGNIVERK